MSQTHDKKNCINWLLTVGGDFTSNIVDLEGYMQCVPDDVSDSFERLSSMERVEVIYESSKAILNNK